MAENRSSNNQKPRSRPKGNDGRRKQGNQGSRNRSGNRPRQATGQRGNRPENRSVTPPQKKGDEGRNRQKRSTNIKITPPADPNENWRRGLKTSLMWVAILISVILLAQLVSIDSEPTKELKYSQYEEYLHDGKIESGKLVGRKFICNLSEPETAVINGVETEFQKFWVVMPPTIDSAILAEWSLYGVDYEFQEETRNWVDYLFTLLPWVLIIFFWFFIMRRMQGAGTKGIFSFGKSRARIIDNEKPSVTFKDVAGCEEAKEELREIVQFLKQPKRFQRLGGKIPRGALLVGPPGTGKTLLARAVAGEAGVPFYSLSGADFVEMFVGVGASRVRDLFEQGKKNAPCIIFIDEIDAVGRQRGAGLGGGHDEREQTLNALLVEMDGFETTDNVILIAATNRPDVLDSALLRPGRFDRRIVVDTPDVRGREAILKVHSKEIPLAKNVRLDVIAKGTPGMSGADLANLINEAALLAARRNHRKVNMEDIEASKDKVMMGAERRSLVISESEKQTTAVHEAGHALVAKLTPGADPVHKVTIIPRGQALGLTAQLPIDDRHNYSRTYVEGMLAILMGGRVAEEIVLDQRTTGAGNDIERATMLARKMVTEWGMSDKLGPMTFGQKRDEIFIGRELGMHRDFSEDMARQIDDEVRGIIDRAQTRARSLIKGHRRELEAISKLLLDKESIDGIELEKIVPHPVSEGRRKQTRRGGRSRSDQPKLPNRESEPLTGDKSEATKRPRRRKKPEGEPDRNPGSDSKAAEQNPSKSDAGSSSQQEPAKSRRPRRTKKTEAYQESTQADGKPPGHAPQGEDRQISTQMEIEPAPVPAADPPVQDPSDS